ncbi:MAG: hypothetical protein WCX65_12055 [bacterium]
MRTVRIFIWTTVWLVSLAGAGLCGFPRLEIIYPPSDRFECSVKNIPLMGRAECPNCALLIGDHAVPILSDGAFQWDMPLKPGKNVVEIYLREAGGNEFRKTLEITRNAPVPGGAALETPAAAAPAATPDVFSDSQSPAPAANSGIVAHLPSNDLPGRKIITKAPQAPIHGTGAIEPAGNATETPIKFFLNGKPSSDGAGAYILKSDRVFLPVESPLWTEAGAVTDGRQTLIFNDSAILKQITVTSGTPMPEASFRANGKLYMPVRYVFERAGRQVSWSAGRVDIDMLYRPCPVDSGGAAKISDIQGIIFKDTLYVKAGSLSKLGIKAQPNGSGGINITGRGGAQIVIAENTRLQKNKMRVFELRNGKSPPGMFSPPGRDITDGEYIVPLRKVASEYGLDVKWDSAGNKVVVAPTVVANSRF